MIGYTLLVLVALVTVSLGAVVVGVAIWGWSQEKKKPTVEEPKPILTLKT